MIAAIRPPAASPPTDRGAPRADRAPRFRDELAEVRGADGPAALRDAEPRPAGGPPKRRATGPRTTATPAPGAAAPVTAAPAPPAPATMAAAPGVPGAPTIAAAGQPAPGAPAIPCAPPGAPSTTAPGRPAEAPPAAAEALPPPAGAPTPAIALSPLEQAVADLLEQVARADRPERDADRDADAPAGPAATFAPSAVVHAPAPHPAAPRPDRIATPAPVREVPAAPEPPANPSHVHLVLDDAGERIVVTVAVRGADVTVAVRGGDDATAAALARNAASLDHAMRARGLDLSSFTAERDRDHPARESPHGRERPPTRSDEPFVLEEIE